MAFLSNLPPEILNQIIDHLDLAQDAKSLTMVNRSHYRLFNDLIYIIDMERRRGFGALCAISKDLHTAIGKFLDLGFGTKFSSTLVKRSNLLHVAAYHGAVFTVKLLLERDADPQEPDEMGRTPLYFAIKYRHGEVIKTLSEAMSDISNVFIDQKNALTPLHGACMEKLPMAARLFLELGDDIHAKDAEALTPLLHTLRHSGRSVTGRHNNDVFDVLMVLREFGLDISLIDWDFSNGAPISSLELGARHQNLKVRELFGRKEPPGPNKLRKGMLVGRPWLNATEHSSAAGKPDLWASRMTISSPDLRSSACASNTSLDIPAMKLVDKGLATFIADDFPVLDTASRSSSNIRQASSIWSHARFRECLAQQIRKDLRAALGNSSDNLKAEAFPQLVPVATIPLNIDAKNKWERFRQVEIPTELSEHHDSLRKPSPGGHGYRKGGSKRRNWTPLKL
jgi:hypothetical protein